MPDAHLATRSVGVWRTVSGDCTCGIPYPADDPPKRTHRHYLECEWGVVQYTQARPDRGEVGPLVIVSRDGFLDLLENGDNQLDKPAVASAYIEDWRLFYRLDYDGQHWIWELFEMHWTDLDDGPDERCEQAPGTYPKCHAHACNLLIGRWSD
jgi:hypothetical protein